MDTGLLLFRLVLGLTLMAHGSQKLFGWFGGPGLDGAGKGFEMLGFVPGRRHARAAGVFEVTAGTLVVLGLATPLAAAIAVSIMIVAAVSVHLKNGFFITGGGVEYTLVLGAGAWLLAFTGPGAWSIDALLGWEHAGNRWGMTALVVAALGAALALAQRDPLPSA